MLKTIKVKKQLRLDELIKYIFDNKIVDKKFSSDIKLEPYYDNKNSVYVHPNGTVSLGLGQTNEITTEDTFTVEVEEEITEDTEFEALVFILVSGRIEVINNYHNIRSARSLFESYETEKRIYAVIDKKLELIWEAENSERN